MAATEDATPFFAIKQLRNLSLDHELAALRALGKVKHHHVNSLLATFEWKEHYYSVYPWAPGGHLLDFWGRNGYMRQVPRGQWFAEWMSTQISGLVDGLSRIHSYMRNGMHWDLTPRNIFYFRPQNGGQFFDLVIGSIKICVCSDPEAKLPGPFESCGYYSTYGAPELELKLPVTQKSDIWALRYILTEFLTWYLYGWD